MFSILKGASVKQPFVFFDFEGIKKERMTLKTLLMLKVDIISLTSHASFVTNPSTGRII